MPIWSKKVLERALKSVERDGDAIWVAGVMLRFFLEWEAGADEEVSDRGVEIVHQEVKARL